MKNSPEEMKILVALAKAYRVAKKDLRAKEKGYLSQIDSDVCFQARAICLGCHHMFCVAKKAANRYKLF
jgi:hypothetical protein